MFLLLTRTRNFLLIANSNIFHHKNVHLIAQLQKDHNAEKITEPNG